MARRHPCDTCGKDRKRWQRLCGSCYGALPHPVRTALIEAWRLNERAAWRGWVRQAKAILAGATAPTRDPRAVYEQTAARMGERG